MKVSFIGGGNMGEAILAAIITNKLAAPQEISVADAKAERLGYLRQKYGVFTTSGNLAAAIRGDVIILAVKPQNLEEVMQSLAGEVGGGRLVLSIIAGKRIETLKQGLRHEAIARAMPNTPAQIGKGMTVWTATPATTSAQRADAESILRVMGREIYVDDEGLLDMATAVSGSGPAYVFLFMEALNRAAEAIGMPPEIALALVQETVLGAAEYARLSERDLAELRRNVTSPGGTTAAALQVFEEAGFTALVERAVAAAYKRAQELGS